MPRPAARVFQVFVSSPGDVAAERAAVVRAVEELRHDPFVAARFVPRAIGWDLPGVGVPLAAAAPPQWQIDDAMPRPADCDVVVVVLGGRLGTPVTIDGHEYRSGTEREYLAAVAGWQRAGRPMVLVYRKSPLPPVPADAPDRAEQLKQRDRVAAFFRDHFHNPDGSLKGGYAEYADPAAFADRVRADLRGIISRHEPAPARGGWLRWVITAGVFVGGGIAVGVGVRQFGIGGATPPPTSRGGIMVIPLEKIDPPDDLTDTIIPRQPAADTGGSAGGK